MSDTNHCCNRKSQTSTYEITYIIALLTSILFVAASIFTTIKYFVYNMPFPYIIMVVLLWIFAIPGIINIVFDLKNRFANKRVSN